MPIARVFARKTSCTPNDEYAFIGDIPLFLPDDIEEVHVSVTFSWDLPEAERLAKAWDRVAPVKMGGPAMNSYPEEFTPGLYLKSGCVITSRGCDNRCWFCLVPKREGGLRELKIHEGNNLLDNNILGCSDEHIKAVFDMLSRQKTPRLTGGIEAKLLKPWHVDEIARAKVSELFCAYDTPDDLEPLVDAAKLFKARPDWYRWRKCGCYCLIGYPNDTLEQAETRLITALKLGFMPFAMFYRDPQNKQEKTKEWAVLQRSWTRPAAINAMRKKIVKS